MDTNNTSQFEQYLQQYKIDPVYLSSVANVRRLTVYNAQKGNPITLENARKIKEAALQLTGTAYTGPFVLIQPATSAVVRNIDPSPSKSATASPLVGGVKTNAHRSNNQPLTFPVKKLHRL